MSAINLTYKLVAPFTPLELAFKYIYENKLPTGEVLSGYPKNEFLKQLLGVGTEDEYAFLRILEQLDSAVLDNDIFFSGTEDVFLNMHDRYMPIYKHTHRFFELQYVLSGTLSQTVAGHELRLSPGDVCFIAPETQHAIAVFDDETIVINILIKVDTFRSLFINLLSANDVISDFFSRVLFCNSFYPYIYCRTQIKDTLDQTILDMVKVKNGDMRYKNRLLITKLEEFFIHLLNTHEYDFVAGSSIGETDKKILPILRYIRDNFRTVTLTEAARYFNYSESYLSRIITSYSGSSFSQILKTARLRNAASLLENTNMSVSEICADSGYEDRTHFHKTFKEEYGMTPAEYRQQHSGQST